MRSPTRAHRVLDAVQLLPAPRVRLVEVELDAVERRGRTARSARARPGRGDRPRARTRRAGTRRVARTPSVATLGRGSASARVVRARRAASATKNGSVSRLAAPRRGLLRARERLAPRRDDASRDALAQRGLDARERVGDARHALASRPPSRARCRSAIRSKHCRTACTGLPMMRSVAQALRRASCSSTSSCRRSVITLGREPVVVVVAAARRRARRASSRARSAAPCARRRGSSRSSRGRGRRCRRRSRCTGRARASCSHVAIGDVVDLRHGAPPREVAGTVEEYGSPIHPHDARSAPGAPARQGGAARHQHLDVPRRQDRRARPQRRRASRRCCGSSPARTTAIRAKCRVTPGFSRRVSCPQEPRLDPTRTCSATSPTASRDTKGLLDRFEEVCNAMGEPDADFDKLLAEQSDLQDKIDARQRLGPRPPARHRDGRAAPARPPTPTSPSCQRR